MLRRLKRNELNAMQRNAMTRTATTCNATQRRYYPTRKRLVRYCESVLVTGAMLAVALLFMICSLNLQVKATSSFVVIFI